MKSKIVIGDVHGQFDALMQLLAQFPREFTTKDICYSGDLIDRGPDNKRTVEFVIHQAFDVCRGNHEDFMAIQDCGPFSMASAWFYTQNGGGVTAAEYADDKETFKEHMNWMKGLPHYLEYKDVVNDKGQHLVVSHSSAAKTWRFRNEAGGNRRWFEHDVLWERDMNAKKIDGIYNIFGHTPQQYKPRIREHWACIDGGGFVGWEPGYKKLYALQFPEMILYEQEVKDNSHTERLKEAGIV